MSIWRIAPENRHLMDGLLELFGEAFNAKETYGGARPSADYQRRLLSDPGFVALVIQDAQKVVGGLVAYELRKFEQERSEFYIYDLAVAEGHRRRGIATKLIRHLMQIAAERGGYVVFVQADRDDSPAIALYSTLGKREDVLHFDIPVA